MQAKVEHGDSFTKNLTEMAHLVMENEKLRRKLKKAHQRRDHYARLYYRVLAELDETKWELTMARNKIRDLKSQVSTTQKTGGSAHPPTQHTDPSHNPHSKTIISQRSGSDSNTTSPDSGASLSPGIEPVNPPFVHANGTKTLPNMPKHGGTATSFAFKREGHGDRRVPREAWNGDITQPRDFGRSEHSHVQEHRPPNTHRQLSKPRVTFTSPPTTKRPAFLVPRPELEKPFSFSQGDAPFSSPLLTTRKTMATFQKQPQTLSQEAYISSPPYVRRVSFERSMSMPQGSGSVVTVQQQPQTLSQEAYISSPPYVRRVNFERSMSMPQGSGSVVTVQQHPQTLSQEAYISSPPYVRRVSFDRNMSMPQGSGSVVTHPSHMYMRRPTFEKTSLSQDDILSGPELSYRSAFRKPVPRRISNPSSSHHPPAPHHPPPYHPPPPHHPPPFHQSSAPHHPPPSHPHPPPSHHHPPPSHHHPPPSHPHPPAPKHPPPLHHLTVHQLQFDTSSYSSGNTTQSPSTVSRVSVGSITTTASSIDTPLSSPREEECHLHNLSGVQILDLLAHISDPKCGITKLEVASSQLGQPEAMRLFCKDLLRNKSIMELSLPGNGITGESLKMLLDCIEHCDNIRELMLRNNLIGKECAEMIKIFLTKTTLDSLVLTGNDIEQYGHLLNGGLPNDFTMEYDTTDGSEDSGLVVTENENSSGSSNQPLHRFKYLHI